MDSTTVVSTSASYREIDQRKVTLKLMPKGVCSNRKAAVMD